MESRNAFVDIGVAVMLTVAGLAAIDAAQASRGGAKSAAPEAAHPRDRVTPVWTDHLKLTTYPSDVVVAPGDRTSLVIEIQPGDGMHVYAPGAEGYKVIALTMAPQSFVRVLPLDTLRRRSTSSCRSTSAFRSIRSRSRCGRNWCSTIGPKRARRFAASRH